MARAKSMHTRRLMIYAARSVLPRSQQTEPVRYLSLYNCFPPPVFMLTISIVEVALYLYYALDSDVGLSAVGPSPVRSPLIFDPHKKAQVWRFFTYMFIHIG